MKYNLIIGNPPYSVRDEKASRASGRRFYKKELKAYMMSHAQKIESFFNTSNLTSSLKTIPDWKG